MNWRKIEALKRYILGQHWWAINPLYVTNQYGFFKCNKYNSLVTADCLSLAKEKNLCFNCFSNGHQTQFCKSPSSSFQQDCSKNYHTAQKNAFQKALAEENQAEPNIEVVMPTHKSNRFYLQIVPLLMSSSIGKREKTYALLDTESQSSLIREDFVPELKLHGKKKTKLR